MGVGWAHQPTLSLRSVPRAPRGPRLLPNTTKGGRKMSQTTRAGWGHRAADSSRCLLSNWVQREGGRNGERKQNPKQQLSNNCFLQYVQSPAGRASPYSSPRGRVRHGHTQLRPMAPRPPAGQRERRGRAGAARPLRGRGRVSAWGQPLWGWGQRTRKPLSSELGSSQEWGTIFLQELVPPALARGWSRDQRGPTCLWQNLSVLVSCCALPAAWGSRPKSKRWMKRGATAPPQQDVLPQGLGGTCHGRGAEEKLGFAELQLRNQSKSHRQELQTGLDCAWPEGPGSLGGDRQSP